MVELLSWVRQLEPSFAFLMGLPVLVAMAGLAAEALRRRARRAAARPRVTSSGAGMPDRAVQAR